jgi:pyruvate/2-oxoacid:ferredoxin oxidoreductase beta subunit
MIATASIAYPIDFMVKVKKALAVDGPTYIHIHSPCPTGWGFPENLTIKISRLAVQTGAFILYEIDKGKLNVSVKTPRRKPIQEYIKLQQRFAHLTQENIMQFQKWIDQRYADFL